MGVAVEAVEAGCSVLFLTFETLMTRLVRARHENRLDGTLTGGWGGWSAISGQSRC